MASSNWDRMLRIDLNRRTYAVEETTAQLEEYVGGMGRGVKLLLDEMVAGADPLGPANRLIFSTGPLTGTLAPMFAQTCLVTKSPLTGTILNTYAGGDLGAEIKFAGYDALIFEGQADDWSYIFIDDGHVSFHDAAHLLKMDSLGTEQVVREELGVAQARVIAIGLAGQNLVKFAAILSGRRVFGRGGAGAVMGSKRLKAIAIRGTRGLDVYDRGAFLAAVDEANSVINKELANEFSLLGMFSRHGTGSGMGVVNEQGALPTRNHYMGYFADADKIDSYAYARDYPTRIISCYACPVHCGQVHHINKGPWAGLVTRGPEYETMYALGSEVLNSSAEALAKANDLCERLGMDTLTAGTAVALALECAEKGIIKGEGSKLKFGDPRAVLTLLEDIAHRRGLGDLLAEGPGVAARELGGEAPAFAMQVKNSGFAAWMPRRMKGTGLSFATANRGGCHKRAPIGAEIMGFVDMDAVEGKAAMVKEIQDKVNAIFTLVGCRFSEFVLPLESYLALLEGATGTSLSAEEFMTLGERIWNLERVFNVAEGFRRKDDSLPGRCYTPIVGERSKGAVLTEEGMNYMLDEYYSLRGWDSEGVPQAAKLAELGIEAYIARMST